MELRYYQYRLGKAVQIFGEMHASLHAFEFDAFDNPSPFLRQVLDCIMTDTPNPILRKHILRGIHIGDEQHTRLIAAADFPIKRFEPGYYNPKAIEFGLSGGDVGFYKPQILVESYCYFWRSIHPFSQWHKCAFTENGVHFNCAEQYMMYKKALLFDDTAIAHQIVQSSNPREQKLLGRKVQNFNADVWNAKALDIVLQGNRAKFSQNQHLLNQLLATKGKTIVEASPDDNIWGIGLAEEDHAAQSVFSWEGTNWLGIALTELREELLGNSLAIGYLTLEELKTNTY